MLEEILKARELRWQRKLSLVEEYNCPVLTVTLNIPGTQKMGDQYLKAHQQILGDFKAFIEDYGFTSKLVEYSCTADGPVCYLICPGRPSATSIKVLSIQFENTYSLGRLADIDVMNQKKEVVSRKDLQVPERKCFLCHGVARNCIITRRHGLSEILAQIQEIVNASLRKEETDAQ